MDDLKLQNYITDWLKKNYATSAHQDILERACRMLLNSWQNEGTE